MGTGPSPCVVAIVTGCDMIVSSGDFRNVGMGVALPPFVCSWNTGVANASSSTAYYCTQRRKRKRIAISRGKDARSDKNVDVPTP